MTDVYKITITAEYEADKQLTDQLIEAKASDQNVSIKHTLEGGVFTRSAFEDYYTQKQICIYEVIHNHCKEADYDPSKVTLYFGNVNVESLYNKYCEMNNITERINVQYFPFWLHVSMYNYNDLDSENRIEHKREKIFTFFNGYERDHRIDALNFLDDNNLLDLCEWTWVNPGNEKINENLIDLLPRSAEGHVHYTEKSTSSCPGEEFYNMHKNTYFDLVAETIYYNDFYQYSKFDWHDTVFFSEKLFRSIKFKRPFLLIGNRNSLSELKKLGFKTFPTMFDESYDTLNNSTRLYHVLEQLKNFTVNKAHDLFYSDEVQDAIEHNYEHAKALLADSQYSIYCSTHM